MPDYFYNLLLNHYVFFLSITGIAVAVITAVRFVKSNSHLNYEHRLARILANLILCTVYMMHTKKSDLNIDGEGKLLALGPHKTFVEAFVVASRIRGAPPQFFTTDAFDSIPFVASFLKMFKTIPVKANPPKEKSQPSNNEALERAKEVLRNKGCVAIYPQGNFAQLGQAPPKIYTGAAKLALAEKVPIHVIRLDGFWCLKNPMIPLFIRNNFFYRVFFSMFHMNNIRTTLCSVIDFHLTPENQELSDEEKINELCAQLYAYYYDTNDLSEQQIGEIKAQIANKTHLLLWKKRVEQENLEKQILVLKKECLELIKT